MTRESERVIPQGVEIVHVICISHRACIDAVSCCEELNDHSIALLEVMRACSGTYWEDPINRCL